MTGTNGPTPTTRSALSCRDGIRDTQIGMIMHEKLDVATLGPPEGGHR
jgi:hypothetical protein